MPKRTSLLITLLFYIFPLFLFAQNGSSIRPKIGYVLSGGGAKGMAHVGVLKVLEEVGLQPDYITGTSMGSIIGGLYSIGYSADEIAELIETIDWGEVLTNEIPSNQVIMRRKHEYQRFLLEMPVYGWKPELPSGLIEGQKLSDLFSELTWRQAGVDDFNEFPVPFECIGTDILKGEKVQLKSGDLSSAMRASMAIPSVFTPVIRDTSHILVDGGVMRNFPVEEALDMGADIIIGVYVGFDSHMKPEQLRSLTSVITRTSLLAGARDVESQIPYVDYYIEPDLQGYSPSSFSDGIPIMNQGEAAARAQLVSLKALADSVNSMGTAPKKKKLLPKNDSILIGEISVQNASPSMTRFITELSGIKIGTWISPAQLNEGIGHLFGTLFFDKIDYFFEELDEGYRLVFRLKEKANASIKVALHYDNAFGPGVILNYTRLNTLIDGSRLGLTVDISESPQFRGYYDFHFGKKRNTIASLFMNSERENLPFYSDGIDIGNYRRNFFTGGLAFMHELGTNNQLKAEFYYNYSNLKLAENIKEVQPGLEYIDNFVFRGPVASLSYQFNTYDSYLYPTRGTQFMLKYRQAFKTAFISNFSYPDSLDIDNEYKEIMDPYWHLIAGLENYLALGKKVSLNTGLATGLSKTEKPFSDNYYVGGYRYNLRAHQVAFVGLNSHEVLNGNYLKGKLAVQYELLPNLFTSALANIIFVSDELEEFLDDIFSWDSDTHYIGAGLGFTYKTPIGPVSVYLGSQTDAWDPIWYTNIGFTF